MGTDALDALFCHVWHRSQDARSQVPGRRHVQSGFAAERINELHRTAMHWLGARWIIFSQSHNIQILTVDYLGPWTSCSASCGGGHQFRALQCMDRRTSAPAEGCDQLEKPRQRQRCANDPCSRSHHSQHSVQNEVKGELRLIALRSNYQLCALPFRQLNDREATSLSR